MNVEQIQATILMVDDNPTNLNVLMDTLKGNGFRLLAAKNGEEAVKRAQTTLPDLVLLDVLMPVMDGFDTIVELKKIDKTNEIPVIFMTALSDTVDKVKGFQLGAVDYITKPFQADEVLARVKSHLTIQHLKNELKKKNQDLQEAIEKEKELNRMKTGLVYLASHELRKPLTVFSLFLDSIQKFINESKEHIQSQEKAKSSIQQMANLLDDILIATRSESGKLTFEPDLCDLKMVSQQLVSTISTIYGEDSSPILFDYHQSTDYLFLDRKLIQIILSNLLSNAVKYSPNKNPIQVKVSADPDYVTIVIKDEGIGISQEDQKKLFQSFQRGENVGLIQGTGLGLAIVKECVSIHQGKISLISEEGKGTEFIVKIPSQPKIAEES